MTSPRRGNSVVFLFFDGVGVGEPDPARNPFFTHGFRAFEEGFGGIPTLEKPRRSRGDRHLFPTDARFGIEGFPLSGTGQTAIFCGVNAPRIFGKHFGPFPPTALRPYLQNESVVSEVKARGMAPAFANAYPRRFFDYLKSGRSVMSATTMMFRLNGVRLNRATDLRRGTALSAEIDNGRWISKLGYSLPKIRPETAARRLLRVARERRFVVFEYFHTDHVGHGRYDGDVGELFGTIDRFLLALLAEYDPETTTIVFSSDHGNVEDVSIKTHTLNPSVGAAAGRRAGEIAERVRRIDDFKDATLALL
jgi:hypothetical protein